MIYVTALFIALGTVYCFVPPIRFAALRFGFVDRPSKRKIHSAPIPLLGGGAIFAGTMVTLLLLIGWTPLTAALAIGGAVLVTTGSVDDWYKSKGVDFAVWPRIILYAAAAAVPIFFGITIAGVRIWSDQMWMFSEGLSALTTGLWVFALVNMMNFIDGVDGLASGIAVISSSALFAVALMKGQFSSAIAALVIVGAALGFLAYNFYPAKIFMGDAGATFLGYALAVISIDGTLKSAAVISMFVPLLALGVPIMDTMIVFTRRLLSGKGLHRADRLHTHHSLLQWGLTQRQTVSFLYLVGAVFSLLSILIVYAVR